MDSLSSTIASLRAALASAAAHAAQIDALVGALPVALPATIPILPLVFPEVPTHPPGTAVGAGLPPTMGAQGPADELPLPAPIQAQQTLGVAIPATFGSAEANAEHYLLGKALYEPSQALLEAEDATYKAWREAMVASNRAPYGKVGAARAAERAAHWALKDASNAVQHAKQLVNRIQDYYDGTFASRSCYRGGGTYFIYRFYVFEELNGAAGVYEATWKPIGLLNPHTYNAYKATGARGKTFMDFVDASQPAPDVMSYWCAEFGVEKDDESLPPCEDEEEEAAPAMVMVPLGGGGGGPSEAVYIPAPPALPPTLSRQNAVTSLSSEVPAAVAAVAPLPIFPDGLPASAAGPVMAYPTLERVEGTMDILDSAVLGEKAMQYESELKALTALPAPTYQVQWRRDDLRRNYEGRWTTLPDGRKALIWAFHAFAPPADGSYRTPQPLLHLGLYNITDRSLDTTEAPPALPKNKADWPW